MKQSLSAENKKLLVLHGNQQTGELLVGRIAKLRKKLSKTKNNNNSHNNHKNNTKQNNQNENDTEITTTQPLELVAPDGPFDAQFKELMKTWWIRNGEGNNCKYVGLEETMEMLHALWTTSSSSSSSSSFTGILGFSQGARLAHLIALLHHHSNGAFFHGLQFIIFASGYDAPLPTNFPPKSFTTKQDHIDLFRTERNLTVPTLHVIGLRDELILPQRSRDLASFYKNAIVHEHAMGHCLPMKAPDVRQILSFISTTLACHQNHHESTAIANHMTLTHLPPNKHMEPPDEEHEQIQMEECESLELIYPDQFHLQSSFQYKNPNDVDEGKTYSHPICYTILIRDENDDTEQNDQLYPIKPLSLQIQYPPLYPDEPPIFSLQHDMNLLEFKVIQENACLNVIRNITQAELGMPCIMSCILAIREFIEDGGLLQTTGAANNGNNSLLTNNNPTRNGTNEALNSNDDDDDDDNDDDDDLNENGTNPQMQFEFLPSVSRERMEQCDLEGQTIADTMLNKITRTKPTNHDSNTTNTQSSQMSLSSSSSQNASSKGGEWKYTIGLVGKPSAGKSTFFNAATAFARQRNDDGGDNDEDSGGIIFGASMAPHPFTTIDPNVGFCLVPAPLDSCPENSYQDQPSTNSHPNISFRGKNIGSTHGRDNQGRRLLPVTLKDVAGLVPGAYQGRGKGNKFLNDLTDADTLIHVVDASGTADTEGNSVGEGVHPLHDLSWIRNELFEWIYGNIASKWGKISRKGKDKLLEMFSGYRQTQAFLLDIVQAIEKYSGATVAELHTWDQGDLKRLISAYLGVRFPMALALNKSDLSSSSKFLHHVLSVIPIHGARVGVPLSARAEMTFMKQSILSSVASTSLNNDIVKETNKNGNADRNDVKNHGVWDCLQSALSLREPLLVFPVNDMLTYAPYPGMNDYATRDASLPSHGMIAYLEASGGVVPSLWNNDRKMYIPTTKENDTIEPLRDVLILKRGSTVEDVFLILKRKGALSGEFVRAEACSNLGEKAKLVSKQEVMGRQNRIIKIMTTKRKEWQKK